MSLVIWTFLIIVFYGKTNTMTITEYACSCHDIQLKCSSSLVIVIQNSSYGVKKQNNCRNNRNGWVDCCAYSSGDCVVSSTDLQTSDKSCLLKTICNISYNATIVVGCNNNPSSDYLRVDYECDNVSVSSTSTHSTYNTTNTASETSTSTTQLGKNSTIKEGSFPSFTATDSTIALNRTDGLRTSNPPVSPSEEGTGTTAKQTARSEHTTSTILTSTASLSRSTIPSSDIQSSSVLTSAIWNSEEGHDEHLTIILAVVLTVIVITAILVITFILYRRRCKQPVEEDASKNDHPNGLINHAYTSCRDSNLSYKAVETSNYDEINDVSIATNSRPVKKKKNARVIAKDEKQNGGNGTNDGYESIEFEKKRAAKMPNYNSVSAIKVKKLDDTYSHVSSQSKPVSAPTTNEYSHGQFIRTESQSNDHTNKTAITDEPLNADNYSHVDLDADRTKRRPSNINEEDSYNHIDLDKTTNPSQNGKALSGKAIPDYEKGSQRFTNDIQSRDVESEGCLINDGDSGVSSQDPPLQGIKAVSLPDKYIEFKIGDIYDTPRCKDQQYHTVLKDNKQQSFQWNEAGSKGKYGIKENNDTAKDCVNSLDYELAKPMDI